MEVEIPAGEGAPSTPAYAVLPAHPRYGVVVIHEAFGRRPDIDRACERIGRAGCAAVAPDLSAQGGLRCIRDMIRATKTGLATTTVMQTRNAQAWLSRETGVEASRVALLGFCIGGGFALAAGHGFGAVSANYGMVPEVAIMRGLGPVIGCFGARDRVFAPKAPVLERRLTELGIKHEVHVFENAGHSFLTDADHGAMRYFAFPMGLGDAPEAREAGWAKIFSFFDACFPT